MTDPEFDHALLAAAFALAAETGWGRVSVAEAARRAFLPLDRARLRFPLKPVLLIRFGRMADAAALAIPPADAPARERLFEVLMRRIDVLQAHREGVLALLRYLPRDPCTSALLAGASARSMRWMLEGAGIEAAGPRGKLRAKGLLAVWLATVHAWRSDSSEDLSATMAALDKALRRAEQVEGWMSGRRADTAAQETTPSETSPSGPTIDGTAEPVAAPEPSTDTFDPPPPPA